ncbi:hypothetical protein GSH05_04955 [Burkholderia pseudomallei]|nr:hypothetical protein [Burkholderia pseudomallei]
MRSRRRSSRRCSDSRRCGSSPRPTSARPRPSSGDARRPRRAGGLPDGFPACAGRAARRVPLSFAAARFA